MPSIRSDMRPLPLSDARATAVVLTVGGVTLAHPAKAKATHSAPISLRWRAGFSIVPCQMGAFRRCKVSRKTV